MIEKIIHQIWLQGEKNIPKNYQENINSIKNNHKEWTYKLWDEIEILKLLQTKKEWIDTYYQFIYMHQKIDFARYVILLNQGGVYLDIDVISVRPLNGLIEKFKEYNLILSKLNANIIESYLSNYVPEIINNGIILSSKNNPVIEKLINNIISNHSCFFLEPKISCITKTTGPNRFTLIINKFKDDKTIILEPEYLEPCLGEMCDTTENTYTLHKHSGTWLPPFVKDLRDYYAKNKLIVFIIFIVIILLIYFVIIKLNSISGNK